MRVEQVVAVCKLVLGVASMCVRPRGVPMWSGFVLAGSTVGSGSVCRSGSSPRSACSGGTDRSCVMARHTCRGGGGGRRVEPPGCWRSVDAASGARARRRRGARPAARRVVRCGRLRSLRQPAGDARLGSGTAAPIAGVATAHRSRTGCCGATRRDGSVCTYRDVAARQSV